MIKESMRYPFRGDETLKQLFIGGILYLGSVLILPVFLLYGYGITVLESTIKYEDEPPKYTDWVELLKKGVGMFAISFVYSLPATVYYVVIVIASSRPEPSLVALGGGLIFSVITGYFVMSAYTHYAATGSLRRAFGLRSVVSFALSFAYLRAFGVILALGLVSYLVVLILVFSVVGILLIPFLYYYVFVVVSHVFGLAYRREQNESAGSSELTDG